MFHSLRSNLSPTDGCDRARLTASDARANVARLAPPQSSTGWNCRIKPFHPIPSIPFRLPGHNRRVAKVVRVDELHSRRNLLSSDTMHTQNGVNRYKH